MQIWFIAWYIDIPVVIFSFCLSTYLVKKFFIPYVLKGDNNA